MHDDPVLAFSSPSSPLESPSTTLSVQPPASESSPLSVPAERAIQGVEGTSSSPPWRFPLGIAVVVLGLGLVVGGLFYLLRQ